jgi:hypothetical protein
MTISRSLTGPNRRADVSWVQSFAHLVPESEHLVRVPRERSLDLSSKVTVGVVLALVTALALGCSSDDKPSASHPTTTRGPGYHGSSTTTIPPKATSSTAPPTSGPPATAAPGKPVSSNPLPPVGTGTAVDLSGGVTVTVVSSKQINATAHNPDDTAGPAVAVTYVIHNGSSSPIDLSQLSVAATYGNGTPADENTSPPSKLLSGTLAPGASQQGTSVFRVPIDQAGAVIVSVQSGAAANVPRFRV